MKSILLVFFAVLFILPSTVLAKVGSETCLSTESGDDRYFVISHMGPNFKSVSVYEGNEKHYCTAPLKKSGMVRARTEFSYENLDSNQSPDYVNDENECPAYSLVRMTLADRENGSSRKATLFLTSRDGQVRSTIYAECDSN